MYSIVVYLYYKYLLGFISVKFSVFYRKYVFFDIIFGVGSLFIFYNLFLDYFRIVEVVNIKYFILVYLE